MYSTLSSDRIRRPTRFGKALNLIFPKLSSQNMRGFDHATILSPSFLGLRQERRAQWPPFVSEMRRKTPRRSWVSLLTQARLITHLQISLKLHEHRGSYWRKKLPWKILEEQFPVPKNKISIGVILLLWQLRCRCNPGHSKFLSLSNTTVVAIFPNRCLWRRTYVVFTQDPEKLYRATLKHTGLNRTNSSLQVLQNYNCIETVLHENIQKLFKKKL